MTNAPLTRQARKRLATRQTISDVATALFFERGFEAVTIDEIAAAADVARMTVTNHFPRKEDLLFDLADRVRDDLVGALRDADPGLSPIEALRRFAHRAFESVEPYRNFLDAGSLKFTATVRASETLKSRARALRDEWAEVLMAELARRAGRPLPDPAARLAAALLLAAWATAATEAHGEFRRTGNRAEASRLLFWLVDRGAAGAEAALAGTPYARGDDGGTA